MAEFQPYPAKRYHAKKAPVIVQSAEEEAALGPDWFDSPKKAAAPKQLQPQKPKE